MCGIAGMVRCTGATIDPAALDRMTDALAHRGPDGRGTWVEKNYGLGHRRLKIIDLSEAASQPMHSPDGRFVVVFNGEIYNFQEQRRALEALGHVFHSKGDTEVLLHLYMQYGEECLGRLRGMFAFAIVDRERQTLFLARDRVGKKPLVYFQQDGVFAFASEIRALKTLPECPSAIDWEALQHFLSLSFLPAPLTGIRGIVKLPAGHSMRVDLQSGKTDVHRYWAMRYHPIHGRPLPEWRERILSTLEESVRLRMIADVPFGALLSGGIDSSLIVALMSRLHALPVKTFSIGSRNEKSELPDAERIAKLFGTDHHAIVLEPDIVKLLPELVRIYETPFGDPSVIPTYSVMQHTRETVTVALSGDGGDEAFGGYLRYPILRCSETCSRMPRPLRSLARGGANLFHRGARSTLSYRAQIFLRSLELPQEERAWQYMGTFTEEEKQSITAQTLHPRAERTSSWFAAHTADARSRADDMLHGAMNADLETYLAEDLLPKVDLGAMAHGLEVRSPFLDHVLLELTASLPSSLQVRGWNTKWILKHAAQTILPRETLTKSKQGFRLPLDAWFRGELRPFVHDRLQTGHPLFWQMFDRSAVQNFLQTYENSSVDYSPQVWMMLWLQEWFSQHAGG